MKIPKIKISEDPKILDLAELGIPVVVDEQSADRSSVPLDPIAVSLIVPHTGIAMLFLVVL